jgi:hypothetical protein
MLPTELWQDITRHVSPADFTNLMLSNRFIPLFEQRVHFHAKVTYHSRALLCLDSFHNESFDYLIAQRPYELIHYRQWMLLIDTRHIDAGFTILAKNEIIQNLSALRVLFPFISTHKYQEALAVFTKLGQIDLVKKLLMSPACDPKAAHVLVWASKRDDLELVQLLVEHDDDPNALLFACQFGYFKITKFLLGKVNYEYENGRCFLLACLFHQTKIVSLLLEVAYFCTPIVLESGLRNAIFYGYIDLVQLLFQVYTPQRDFLVEMIEIGTSHESVIQLIQTLLKRDT